MRVSHIRTLCISSSSLFQGPTYASVSSSWYNKRVSFSYSGNEPSWLSLLPVTNILTNTSTFTTHKPPFSFSPWSLARVWSFYIWWHNKIKIKCFLKSSLICNAPVDVFPNIFLSLPRHRCLLYTQTSKELSAPLRPGYFLLILLAQGVHKVFARIWQHRKRRTCTSMFRDLSDWNIALLTICLEKGML